MTVFASTESKITGMAIAEFETEPLHSEVISGVSLTTQPPEPYNLILLSMI